MARGTITSYRVEDARVTIEFDTGGPVGSSHVVFVSGTNESDEDWGVVRWFYFDEWNERYARNFAEKVATDDEYREASLERTEDWARVADVYEDAAKDIYDQFSSAGVLGYTMGDTDEERVYRESKDVMNRICRELFQGVKTRIRSPNSVDEDEPGLDEFITGKMQEAEEWTRSGENTLVNTG